MIPTLTRAAATVALACCALGTAGCLSGPTVSMSNCSETDLRVTYWVRDADPAAADGTGGFRSDFDDTFILPAGVRDWRRLGSFWRPNAVRDTRVRVRVEPVEASEVSVPPERTTQYGAREPYWFAFSPDPPYSVSVEGTADDLRFRSLTDASLEKVPTEARFPYRDEDRPSMTDPYAEREAREAERENQS